MADEAKEPEEVEEVVEKVKDVDWAKTILARQDEVEEAKSIIESDKRAKKENAQRLMMEKAVKRRKEDEKKVSDALTEAKKSFTKIVNELVRFQSKLDEAEKTARGTGINVKTAFLQYLIAKSEGKDEERLFKRIFGIIKNMKHLLRKRG